MSKSLIKQTEIKIENTTLIISPKRLLLRRTASFESTCITCENKHSHSGHKLNNGIYLQEQYSSRPHMYCDNCCIHCKKD